MADTERYIPTNPPRAASDDLRRYLDTELERIALLLNELLDRVEELEP